MRLTIVQIALFIKKMAKAISASLGSILSYQMHQCLLLKRLGHRLVSQCHAKWYLIKEQRTMGVMDCGVYIHGNRYSRT